MNKLISLVVAICFIGCTDNSTQRAKKQAGNIDTLIHPYIFDCFKSVDTTRPMITSACDNTFYKVIDSDHVIVIHNTAPLQFDSCAHILINTTNRLAELLVFKRGEANIVNFCNDYSPKPLPERSLVKAFGDFYIKLYKPIEYRGTDKPTASIYIPGITFLDSLRNTQVKIKDELLWKVYQLGPAG